MAKEEREILVRVDEQRRAEHGSNSFRKRESCNKELDNSDESESTQLCQCHLEISEENEIDGNIKDKYKRRGIFIYSFRAADLLHVSTEDAAACPTQHILQPNLYSRTEQTCMHRSNGIMLMLKCPKRRDKCS